MSTTESDTDLAGPTRQPLPTKWLVVDRSVDRRGQLTLAFSFYEDNWLQLLAHHGDDPFVKLYVVAPELPSCTRLGSIGDGFHLILNRDDFADKSALPSDAEVRPLIHAVLRMLQEMSGYEWLYSLTDLTLA